MRDLLQVDPVGHVTTLYRDKITSLVAQRDSEVEKGVDPSYTQKRLDAMCEALTALDKVRDLQLYQKNYDDLTMAHRRKIAGNCSQVRG